MTSSSSIVTSSLLPLHCCFLQHLLLFCPHAFYTWHLPSLQPPSYSPIACGFFPIVASGHQVQPIALQKETEKDNRMTTAEILGNIRSLVSDLFGCQVCRWCVVTVHVRRSYLHQNMSVTPSTTSFLQSFQYGIALQSSFGNPAVPWSDIVHPIPPIL